MQRQTVFFTLAPWGPGEGSKGQISFNFNNKVNFKDFSYQTFPKIKVTKHIRRVFRSVAWVMPQGGTLGRWECPGGGGGGQKIQTWSCGISNQRGGQAEQNTSKIFFLGSNW